jgi:hypothetical protein
MTPIDPELLKRVTASMTSGLTPVRPIPARTALVARLLTVFAGVALAGGAVLGFNGARRLDPLAAAAIFAAIGVFASLGATAAASAMVPGSRWFPPAVPAIAGSLALAVIFAAVFPDHSAGRFLPQGLQCFTAGVLCAIPAAVGASLSLRRGFATDRRAAGVAVGTLAGFAGLAMLELHCPNLRLPHVAVWHLAVVAAAAAAGYFFGSKRSDAELMQ